MLAEELLELVNKTVRQKSEGQTLEVKAAHVDCPKRLYDTLSSFSNQDAGGIIVFGLDEKQGFAAVGVYDLQDLQKNVTEQCNQMEPPVRAVFTAAELEGKLLCAAEIPAVDLADRPCYYMGRGRIKGSFVRVGDADLPMTDYELYSLEAFRKHLHDDERPVERASLDTLDPDRLQRYLLDKRLERPGFAQLPEHQALEMLNITRDGTPTLAAVMNFCVYPQGYFPQLAITAVVVPGTEIGQQPSGEARFLDNKRIEGTIQTMVEDAMVFCRRSMRVQTVIDPETGRRQDRTEYPLEAIRETVLNALIHRDYSPLTEGTPVQINFFTDRLEIHSPGSLYGRMTVEQLGYARPDLRNPALAVMAEGLVGAENRYSGIPTIRREMAAHGLPEPVFENRRNEFVVTLYNQSSALAFSESLRILKEQSAVRADASSIESLLEFCRTPRSRKEITQFLGLKTAGYAMERYIRPLLAQGKLEMTLPEKPRSSHQQFQTIR